MPNGTKRTGILGVKNISAVFLFNEFKTLKLLDQVQFQAHPPFESSFDLVCHHQETCWKFIKWWGGTGKAFLQFFCFAHLPAITLFTQD